MATATLSPAEAPAGSAPGTLYRMTAEAFFRAVDADVFPRGSRVGLWEGLLYEKMAKKLSHSVAGTYMLGALIRALPGGWSVWPENPILVDDFTAPLPDLALVRGEPDLYARRGVFPKAADIGLVVELADPSLKKNRTRTLEVYARAGLPTYWVVNLVDRRVEVYSGPRAEGGAGSYEFSETYGPGTAVPLVLDGREAARIPVADLLPEEAEEPR